MLNASKVHADTSPVAPASLPSDTPEQGPNPFEALGTMSDVGGLGFLFDHDPFEWAPAPLQTQTSPAGDVNANQEALYQIGEGQVDTIVPQNDPYQAQVVAPQPARGWSFTDTLRKEVTTFQGRVQEMLSGGSGD